MDFDAQRITDRDVTAQSRELFRMAERAYTRANGRAPVDAAGWSVPDPRSLVGDRLAVPEAFQAWVADQYGRKFAAWALWGPEPCDERLSRYESIGDWAWGEGIARRIDRSKSETPEWVTFGEFIQGATTGHLLATVFKGALDVLTKSTPETIDRILLDVFQIANALHAVIGCLTPQQVWNTLGNEGQRRVMDNQTVRLRQTAHRLLVAHFAPWRGLAVDLEGASTLVDRLRIVLNEATTIELDALSLFGLDHEIELCPATWATVSDMVATERMRRQTDGPARSVGFN